MRLGVQNDNFTLYKYVFSCAQHTPPANLLLDHSKLSDNI